MGSFKIDTTCSLEYELIRYVRDYLNCRDLSFEFIDDRDNLYEILASFKIETKEEPLILDDDWFIEQVKNSGPIRY